MAEEKKDNSVPISDLMEKLDKLDKLDSLPDWTLADYQLFRTKIYLLENRINNLGKRE